MGRTFKTEIINFYMFFFYYRKVQNQSCKIVDEMKLVIILDFWFFAVTGKSVANQS